MSTLEKAIEIAARAHAGQADKGGNPYILHPIRLMLSLHGEMERMTAVLHDVVEDTGVTLDDLRREGFPEPVLTAIEALTKRPHEDRMEAAHRAAENPISLAVKLADVTDNMDLGRITDPTEHDLERLREYEEVRALLVSKSVL